MAKLFSVLFALAILGCISAGPIEKKEAVADDDLATAADDDLASADTIGYGYYAAPVPVYYGGYGSGGYKYGGYSGYSGYGGYRSYGGAYYRPRIYPVWG